jgi:hypothetical protein
VGPDIRDGDDLLVWVLCRRDDSEVQFARSVVAVCSCSSKNQRRIGMLKDSDRTVCVEANKRPKPMIELTALGSRGAPPSTKTSEESRTHAPIPAAQRIGLQLRQPALTGLAEATELNARRLPDPATPSWLVSAASPC